MGKKVTFYFFAALVFLTSSVVGIDGEGTPKNKLQHPVTPGTDKYFTPEQGSIQEETAFNRAQADRVNGSESDLYLQDENDINQVVNYLTPDEQKSLKEGYPITSNSIPDEYFE